MPSSMAITQRHIQGVKLEPNNLKIICQKKMICELTNFPISFSFDQIREYVRFNFVWGLHITVQRKIFEQTSKKWLGVVQCTM